jgi:exodeoxyribonuclease VII small subunit
MSDRQPRKFEEDLAELESLVAQIDSGELSLEESINSFEQGVGLVRALNQKLDEVDRRIEVLTRASQDQLKSTPYQGDLSNGENDSSDESEDEF